MSALAITTSPNSSGLAKPEEFGDVVIARADIAVSYHLSVVIDDALDGINLVTRGNDLAQFTHVHRLLQGLLGLPVPEYCHHVLVCDANGKRPFAICIANKNVMAIFRHR